MPTPEDLKTIAAYIVFAVPATVAISNGAKILLEWLKQSHAIRDAQIKQSHEITTHYLNKALDPAAPLAIRHQLLRFLATPDKRGTRLSTWAENELGRVGGIVDETNRAVAFAENEIQEAKTAAELAAAERRLAEAVRKQRSLLEPPLTPPITAAAIRAGLVEEKKLRGLEMKGQNLRRADLAFRELVGANFSGADLTNAVLQGSDLRLANFNEANLKGTVFYGADLRQADLSRVTVDETDFQQAHLEGANLTGMVISGPVDFRATYDDTTRWPEGFDPEKAGAVHVHPATSPNTQVAAAEREVVPKPSIKPGL